MSYLLKQNQTSRPLLFLLLSSTDHVSAVTGVTPTVTLSKNGGAFAAPAGAVTEVGNGWYAVAGNATDENTLGPLLLHATGTGADPCDVQFEVVPELSGLLASSGLDAVLVESGITAGATLTDDAGTQLTAVNARQALALALSALAGVLAGGGTTAVTIKPGGNASGNTRVTATVDASGNRSALTLKVPT